MSFLINNSYVINFSLNNMYSFNIGIVICPRAFALALGLLPRANTTAFGQITVPLLNILFNNIYN